MNLITHIIPTYVINKVLLLFIMSHLSHKYLNALAH
jgi:hypothetical protein